MEHAAGWYPDGSTPGVVRWWDGQRWTEHTAPLTPSPGNSPGAADTARPAVTMPTSPPVAPLAAPPAPAPVAPLTPTPFGVEGFGAAPKKPIWKRWWAIAAVAVVAIVAVAAAVGGGSSDDKNSATSDPQTDGPVATDVVATTSVDGEDAVVDGVPADSVATPTTAPAVESDPDPDADPDSGSDTGAANGSRQRPYQFGVEVPVVWDTFGDADGSVWNASVSAPRDIAADISAENQFNDPPPDGVVFLGFDVSMTLVDADKEPLSSGFNITWEVLGGSTAAVYDYSTIETESFGCGVVPGELDQYSEVFVGGTVSGTVCIPVPVEDVGVAGTQISMTFTGGERILFAADGGTGPAALAVPAPAVTPASGSGPADGSRQNPYAFDMPVDVELATYGDADGSVWATTIGAPRDITADVMQENQFNDPPEDGVVFVGFDVSMTLVSADKEPLAPAFNFDFEFLGGASATVYEQFTIGFGCGVSPNDFDGFAEVLVGGTLSGTVCIPVPAADVADAGSSISIGFSDGSRVVFHG